MEFGSAQIDLTAYLYKTKFRAKRRLNGYEICEILASEIEVLSQQIATEPLNPKLVKMVLGEIDLRSSLEERKVALAADRRLAMKYRQAASRPWLATPNVRPQ